MDKAAGHVDRSRTGTAARTICRIVLYGSAHDIECCIWRIDSPCGAAVNNLVSGDGAADQIDGPTVHIHAAALGIPGRRLGDVPGDGDSINGDICCISDVKTTAKTSILVVCDRAAGEADRCVVADKGARAECPNQRVFIRRVVAQRAARHGERTVYRRVTVRNIESAAAQLRVVAVDHTAGQGYTASPVQPCAAAIAVRTGRGCYAVAADAAGAHGEAGFLCLEIGSAAETGSFVGVQRAALDIQACRIIEIDAAAAAAGSIASDLRAGRQGHGGRAVEEHSAAKAIGLVVLD